MHAKLDLSLMCRCQRRHPRKRNWHSSSLTNYQTYEKQTTCQQTSCLIKPSCIETNQYIREKAKHFQDGMFLYPDYGTSLWKANSSGTVRIAHRPCSPQREVIRYLHSVSVRASWLPEHHFTGLRNTLPREGSSVKFLIRLYIMAECQPLLHSCNLDQLGYLITSVGVSRAVHPLLWRNPIWTDQEETRTAKCASESSNELSCSVWDICWVW